MTKFLILFLNMLVNMTSWQLFSKLYYQIKYFIILVVLRPKARNKFALPIFASLRPSNTAPFEEVSPRWRAVQKKTKSERKLQKQKQKKTAKAKAKENPDRKRKTCHGESCNNATTCLCLSCTKPTCGTSSVGGSEVTFVKRKYCSSRV